MAELALNGGKKSKSKPFPVWPQYDDVERKALTEVLESRVWWRTPGTRTLAFEQEFARFHGAKLGIAVTNGTAALEVTMSALGIGPGDEVILPDFTFVATASAVLYAGALPVMVDVSLETYCIDPELAEAAITPRTKAIIAVHMGGHPADLDALTSLAKRKGIALVEDSSHAHATEWNGKRIGSHGVAGTFSFQASKLMTAGEGGIIISNDELFERRARSVHDCGRMPGEWFYSHYINGSNYRLSEWQGAILSAQLARLDAQTQKRHCNARQTPLPDPRHYATETRPALHPEWSIRLHLPRRHETICRSQHRETHSGHERGRCSEPSQLSARPRHRRVPKRRIPEAPLWLTSNRAARLPHGELSRHVSCSVGNHLGSAAGVTRRRRRHARDRRSLDQDSQICKGTRMIRETPQMCWAGENQTATSHPK